MKIESIKIGIVGLGYVGLPLAVAFAEKYSVVGFDVNIDRIKQLKSTHDSTGEVSSSELNGLDSLTFCSDPCDLASCNFFIVTVPTPVDSDNKPDLTPLKLASESLGGVIRDGDFVVYESTVYPGVTEEICIPILEDLSGLVLNKSLFCGYSPERINPGDKENKLQNIKKVTSGSNSYAALVIDELYSSIIAAGTHLAPSIRVAETAKVVENTQRDLNIALMNELAVICDHVGINTSDVINAASTKWNFHQYRPGLVGGHCIGVDPYYLTYKAELEGYIPDVILAGRKINDGMAKYVADRFVGRMSQHYSQKVDGKVLVLGFTFKENCPDIRNTKVYDLVKELEQSKLNVHVYDAQVTGKDSALLDISFINEINPHSYDGIVIAVPHRDIVEWGIDKIRSFGRRDCFVFDLKAAFASHLVDDQL